jgi:small conductance mechanosensitive channel
MDQSVQQFAQFITANTFLAHITRIIIILILTWLGTIVGSWLAVRFLKARGLTRKQIDERRLITVQSLVGSAVKIVVYLVGFIALLLSLGMPGGSILTAMALFSAGFGFAARPIISDYLTGIIFIFEDQFSVGDKVEILEIIGIVETIDLRNTYLRSISGELYVIPNGDVRVVRNLSRGIFSLANVKVTIPTKDLSQAMHVLGQVADTAQTELPDLIERPEFLSEEGSISAHVELTLSAKARYGRGARLRTRLMAMVTEALAKAEVNIIN